MLLLATASPAAAQTEECDRLRQEIASAGRPDSERAAQFVRALQRQRIELARTQAYADQIGCSHGWSIFGSDAPPQCDSIQAQIERMNGNLSGLQQQIAGLQGGDQGRQAALSEQYRASCSPDYSNEIDPNGLSGDMRQGFDDGDAQPGEGRARRGGSKAICVRTCDGGFFPLSFSASQRDMSGLQSLCTALCPNTEAKLYTTSDTDDVGAAVSIDGASYKDLPNAFRYQKTFDAACSCKPANKTWVEALADAEKLLSKGGSSDVTVTTKMSDDMARPVAAPAPGGKKKGFNKADIKALLDAQKAAEGALGAVGAQAPTASGDSAGIGRDAGAKDNVVKTSEGEVKTLPGPGGASRRVRKVGPAL